MSVLRSGFIVLFLAVPFFLYGAWQARGLTDVPTIVSDPPIEKKGSPVKDQSEAARTWVTDIQKMESLALQFRLSKAGDDVSTTDEDGKALNDLMKSIDARSAELTNLESFLLDVDPKGFPDSRLRESYMNWQTSKVARDDATKSIENWFSDSATKIKSIESARSEMEVFQQYLSKYTKVQFAVPAQAAAWRVKCRVEVIKSLERISMEPYVNVLNLPLPLPRESDSPEVKQALGGPRAILDYLQSLTTEMNQAQESHYALQPSLMAEANEAIRRTDEWKAKEELLSLFADRGPLNEPSKAGEWLANIEAQYRKTQGEAQRSLIRKKVQQFCNVFIPAAAKLDDIVLLESKKVPRLAVKIVYAADAKEKSLSENPNELNEFNFTTRYEEFYKIRWENMTTGKALSLEPTSKSRLAFDFTQVRKGITSWSVDRINYLKTKCGVDGKKLEGDEAKDRRELMESLIGIAPTGTSDLIKWDDANSKILTRLTVLSNAIEKYPALFD